MTEQDAHSILTDRYNSIMNNRSSAVFLRKSDNSFLGTDISVSSMLNNPELYYAEDQPKLFEIIKGLFLGTFDIINNSNNAIISVG